MPELQTSLQGVAPWLERAASGMANDPGIISFSKAFERAQEQKSPLYQAQVRQIDASIQNMGYQMERQKLGLEMDQAAKADMLEGKRSASEMAGAMAKVKDWSDPAALASMDAIYAKRPTKEGKAMLDEAAVRHKEAVDTKTRLKQYEILATSRETVATIHNQGVDARKAANETGRPQFFEEGGVRYVWFPGGKTAKAVGESKTDFVKNHLNAFINRFGRNAMQEIDKAWEQVHPPESELPESVPVGPRTSTLNPDGTISTDEPPRGYPARGNRRFQYRDGRFFPAP